MIDSGEGRYQKVLEGSFYRVCKRNVTRKQMRDIPRAEEDVEGLHRQRERTIGGTLNP